MYKIYCLISPDTNKIFYVGITCKSLNDRLKEHLRSHNNRVRKMADSLKKKSMLPIIELLEETTYKNVSSRERDWVVHLLSKGHKLYNKVLIPIKSSQPVCKKGVHVQKHS